MYVNTPIPTVSTKGSLIHVTDNQGMAHAVPIGMESMKLMDTLLALFHENGLLEGVEMNVKGAHALVSGVLGEMPHSHFSLFEWLLSAYTGVNASIPTKADEATLEGKSIEKCPHSINAMKEILQRTENGMYFGKFQIISIGGGDSKLHTYFVDDGEIYHVDSTPFLTKFGTKRIDPVGWTEILSYTETGLPTFFMTSIGYGVKQIVRAANAVDLLSDESDENTLHAVAALRALAPHYTVNDNCWIIPRRTYGSDLLPLNMLGGLNSSVKIDAGTATWKVELPNGKISKIPVDSSSIVAETAFAYTWVYP